MPLWLPTYSFLDSDTLSACLAFDFFRLLAAITGFYLFVFCSEDFILLFEFGFCYQYNARCWSLLLNFQVKEYYTTRSLCQNADGKIQKWFQADGCSRPSR